VSKKSSAKIGGLAELDVLPVDELKAAEEV
jgi:hypothetical protein